MFQGVKIKAKLSAWWVLSINSKTSQLFFSVWRSKSRVKFSILLQYGPVAGAIFADYGTDFGSGQSVPGMWIVTIDYPIF